MKKERRTFVSPLFIFGRSKQMSLNASTTTNIAAVVKNSKVEDVRADAATISFLEFGDREGTKDFFNLKFTLNMLVKLETTHTVQWM
jgi:hypothetical protein